MVGWRYPEKLRWWIKFVNKIYKEIIFLQMKRRRPIFFFSGVRWGKFQSNATRLGKSTPPFTDIERKLLWIVFTYTRMQWKSLRLCPFTRTRTIFCYLAQQKCLHSCLGCQLDTDENNAVYHSAFPWSDVNLSCQFPLHPKATVHSSFNWRHIHPGKLHRSNQRWKSYIWFSVALRNLNREVTWVSFRKHDPFNHNNE